MHFHGFLLCRSYKASAKKVQKSYLSLKSRVKFKEELTCGFKYVMRNLVNFHPTQKSENFFSMGSFCPKYTRFELQKYRGVIFHDTEQWCKIWVNPVLVVSKMVWGVGKTFIRALKSLKNCTLMGSFCSRHIMFQLENFRVIMCYDTKYWCKGKLTRSLKNNIKILVNFHASSRKSEKFALWWLLLPKADKVLDEKEQKSYASRQWRMMQCLKKNWLLNPRKWHDEFGKF